MVHFDGNEQCCIKMGGNAIVVTAKPSKLGWAVNGANLTPIGSELISLLPLCRDSKLREVAVGIKEHTFAKRVEIGDILDTGGHFSIQNLHEVG